MPAAPIQAVRYKEVRMAAGFAEKRGKANAISAECRTFMVDEVKSVLICAKCFPSLTARSDT
jgi:hypothetical protein